MRMQSLPAGWRKGIAAATVMAVAAALGAPAVLGAPTVLAADDTAPAAPRNLVLTPARVTETGAVALDWESSISSDVKAYEVYRWYGSGTPKANEFTYLGTTAELWYDDTTTAEGQYRYAVRAVDEAGSASALTPWRAVTYNNPANGEQILADTQAPGAPTEVEMAAEFSRDGLVDLSWTAPADEDLARFLVYRARGSESAQFAGYVDAGYSYFQQDLTEDGRYTYHVLAQDLAGNVSAVSPKVSVTIDTVAPAVEVTVPEQGETYRPEGSLVVTARIVEDGSGYEPDAVEYYLDGQRLTSPVIRLAGLADGRHQVEVRVADRAGNLGYDTVWFSVDSAPLRDAPVMLTDSAVTRSRTVAFQWAAPQARGVTGYKIYRSLDEGTAELIGTTGASDLDYEDTVARDGIWSYYVVARFDTQKGAASGIVSFTVDRTSPTVRISSPVGEEDYDGEGTISLTYRVRDNLSGVDANGVQLKLDGKTYTGSSIDLSRLAEGDHEVEVIATDRAGNVGSAEVIFTVVSGSDDDDDDSDDDDDKAPVDAAFRDKVLKCLAKWESKIHHGQYNALRAKAMAGNWFSFVKQVQKFEGKFIHRDAARELLSLFDLEDDDDDNDAVFDTQAPAKSKPGKGNNGKGNGNGR